MLPDSGIKAKLRINYFRVISEKKKKKIVGSRGLFIRNQVSYLPLKAPH